MPEVNAKGKMTKFIEWLRGVLRSLLNRIASGARAVKQAAGKAGVAVSNRAKALASASKSGLGKASKSLRYTAGNATAIAKRSLKSSSMAMGKLADQVFNTSMSVKTAIMIFSEDQLKAILSATRKLGAATKGLAGKSDRSRGNYHEGDGCALCQPERCRGNEGGFDQGGNGLQGGQCDCNRQGGGVEKERESTCECEHV